MVLPSLIVGNELLILGGVGLGITAWFLAHRHGELRGMVAAAKGTSGAEAETKTSNSFGQFRGRLPRARN